MAVRFNREAVQIKLKGMALERVKDLAFNIFTKSQENLVNPNKDGWIITDEGQLLQSGDVFPLNESTWRIIYRCPYADDIENGSEPHFVDPQELEGWVRRKMLKKKGDSTKIAKASKRIAINVANKIGREGTEPTFFLHRAVKEEVRKFQK